MTLLQAGGASWDSQIIGAMLQVFGIALIAFLAWCGAKAIGLLISVSRQGDQLTDHKERLVKIEQNAGKIDNLTVTVNQLQSQLGSIDNDLGRARNEVRETAAYLSAFRAVIQSRGAEPFVDGNPVKPETSETMKLSRIMGLRSVNTERILLAAEDLNQEWDSGALTPDQKFSALITLADFHGELARRKATGEKL